MTKGKQKKKIMKVFLNRNLLIIDRLHLLVYHYLKRKILSLDFCPVVPTDLYIVSIFHSVIIINYEFVS